MPKMDGHKASRLIRAAEAAKGLPPVPIVAITAGNVSIASDVATYQEPADAKEKTFNELLHKPFNSVKLATIFKKCILSSSCCLDFSTSLSALVPFATSFYA